MWEITESENSVDAVVIINGSEYDVEAGQNLKDVILGFARDAGFKKFRLYIDDDEVLPQDAPELVEAGHVYKIVQYDQAG